MPGLIVDAVVELPLQFLLLAAQLLKVGVVNDAALAAQVSVSVLVDPVSSLAFSRSQEAAFVVFAFIAHVRAPFKAKGTPV